MSADTLPAAGPDLFGYHIDARGKRITAGARVRRTKGGEHGTVHDLEGVIRPGFEAPRCRVRWDTDGIVTTVRTQLLEVVG